MTVQTLNAGSVRRITCPLTINEMMNLILLDVLRTVLSPIRDG